MDLSFVMRSSAAFSNWSAATSDYQPLSQGRDHSLHTQTVTRTNSVFSRAIVNKIGLGYGCEGIKPSVAQYLDIQYI